MINMEIRIARDCKIAEVVLSATTPHGATTLYGATTPQSATTLQDATTPHGATTVHIVFIALI